MESTSAFTFGKEDFSVENQDSFCSNDEEDSNAEDREQQLDDALDNTFAELADIDDDGDPEISETESVSNAIPSHYISSKVHSSSADSQNTGHNSNQNIPKHPNTYAEKHYQSSSSSSGNINSGNVIENSMKRYSHLGSYSYYKRNSPISTENDSQSEITTEMVLGFMPKTLHSNVQHISKESNTNTSMQLHSSHVLQKNTEVDEIEETNLESDQEPIKNHSSPVFQYLQKKVNSVDHNSNEAIRKEQPLNVPSVSHMNEFLKLKKDIEETRSCTGILTKQVTSLTEKNKHYENMLQMKDMELFKLATDYNELKGKFDAMTVELIAEKNAKDTLQQKNESASATIKALGANQVALARSETVAHYKDQHEEIVKVLKQRHKNEILEFKKENEKLASTSERKAIELQQLKEALNQKNQEYDKLIIEKSQIVNQFRNTLQASQQQCEQLLASGKITEVTQLQIRIKQLESEKLSLESYNNLLKEQMTECKSEIQALYYSKDIGDKMVSEKELLNGDFPEDIHPAYKMLVNTQTNLDQTLNLLQKQKSVNEASEKKLLDIEKELLLWKKRSADYQQKYEVVNKDKCQLEDQLSTVAPHGSIPIVQHNKELSELKNQNIEIQNELKDIKERLVEVSRNESKLNELNRQLRAEMSTIVKQHDIDKQQSREEWMKDHTEEIIKLREAHQLETSALNKQIERLNEELNVLQKSEIAENKVKLENEIRNQVKKEMKKSLEKDIKKSLEKELRLKLNKEIQHQLEIDMAVQLEKHKLEIENKLKTEWEEITKPELENNLRILLEQELKSNLENDIRIQLEKDLTLELESNIKEKLEKNMQNELKKLGEELEKNMREELEKDIKIKLKRTLRAKLLKEIEEDHQKKIKALELKHEQAKEEWINERVNEIKSYEERTKVQLIKEYDILLDQYKNETEEKAKKEKEDFILMYKEKLKEFKDETEEKSKKEKENIIQMYEEKLKENIDFQVNSIKDLQINSNEQVSILEHEAGHIQEIEKILDHIISNFFNQANIKTAQLKKVFTVLVQKFIAFKNDISKQKEENIDEINKIKDELNERYESLLRQEKTKFEDEMEMQKEEHKSFFENLKSKLQERWNEERDNLEEEFNSKASELRLLYLQMVERKEGDYKSKICELEEENEKLRNDIQDLHNENNKLHNEMMKVENENAKIHRELIKKNEAEDFHNQQLKVFKEKEEESRIALTSEKEALKKLREKWKKITKDSEILKSELDVLQKKLVHSENSNKELIIKVKNLYKDQKINPKQQTFTISSISCQTEERIIFESDILELKNNCNKAIKTFMKKLKMQNKNSEEKIIEAFKHCITAYMDAPRGEQSFYKELADTFTKIQDVLKSISNKLALESDNTKTNLFLDNDDASDVSKHVKWASDLSRNLSIPNLDIIKNQRLESGNPEQLHLEVSHFPKKKLTHSLSLKAFENNVKPKLSPKKKKVFSKLIKNQRRRTHSLGEISSSKVNKECNSLSNEKLPDLFKEPNPIFYTPESEKIPNAFQIPAHNLSDEEKSANSHAHSTDHESVNLNTAWTMGGLYKIACDIINTK